MELRHLRYFIAVAEELNITRAAKRIHISQPPLSRQIADLEDEIGVPLFHRRNKSLSLTLAGQSLLVDARQLLSDAELAIHRARIQAEEPTGVLGIGYLVSAGEVLITPLISCLRETNPELRLKFYDMSPKEQVDALRAGEIDFAIAGQEGDYARDEFQSRVLCSIGACVAISSSDPLAESPALSLKHLESHTFIAVDDSEAPGRNRWMQELCRSAGFTPRLAGFIDGITHVFSEVAASVRTATLLPGYFENFSHPGVSFLPLEDAVECWNMLLLWPQGEDRSDINVLLEALEKSAYDLPGYTPSSD